MKIFYVIAILCSLFIVVNGQTAQEYTFTLRNSENSNLGADNTVELGIDFYTTETMIWDSTTQRFSASLNLDPSALPDDEYYYIVDSERDFMLVERSVSHPCITLFNAGSGKKWIFRKFDKFDTGKFVYDDVYGEPPACNVGSIQCGEFVYRENGLPNSGGNYDCDTIKSSDISTLKTALAESSSFNGNCEMST